MADDERVRGRTPDCLPFCLGGWHEETCPVVSERVIPPGEGEAESQLPDVLDDIDGDLAEIEEIAAARAAGHGYQPTRSVSPDEEGLPDCEGWICQSCGADNFIPAGFARVNPTGERERGEPVRPNRGLPAPMTLPEEKVAQVVMLGPTFEWFQRELRARGLFLFRIPTGEGDGDGDGDELPTFGIGVGDELMSRMPAPGAGEGSDG